MTFFHYYWTLLKTPTFYKPIHSHSRSAKVHGPLKFLALWRSVKLWLWSWPSRTTIKSSTCWSVTAWLTTENVLPFNWLTKRAVSLDPSSCPSSPRLRTLVPVPPSYPMPTSRPSSSLIAWRFTSNVLSRFAGTLLLYAYVCSWI